MRYFLNIAYNGFRFHGWQSQPNAISIQECLEIALSTLCRKNILITGAGRTDTGVHARKMYAHFDIENRIEDKKRFLLSLNRLSGPDILVRDLIEVPESAHARFDATQRTYKYFISVGKDVFMYPFFWQAPLGIDIQKMNYAAQYLTDIEDFTSFAKLHSDAKTNICKVSFAKWSKISEDPECLSFIGSLNDGYVFTISADRFLRNMVRAIVGTLIDIGRGKISFEDFKRIINAKDRCMAGTSMPSKALFLWDIKYPYI